MCRVFVLCFLLKAVRRPIVVNFCVVLSFVKSCLIGNHTTSSFFLYFNWCLISLLHLYAFPYHMPLLFHDITWFYDWGNARAYKDEVFSLGAVQRWSSLVFSSFPFWSLCCLVFSFFSGFCSCLYLQCTSLCLWWIHAFMHTVFSLHIKQCMKSPLEHLLLNFRWTVSEISLLSARVKSRRTGMTLV